MIFGPWTIDDAPETLVCVAKRLNNAEIIKRRQIRIIGEHHASIAGSGLDPYDVTFDSCTCMDFQAVRTRHGCPCKHMIRLAIEEGITDGIPVFSPSKNQEIDFSHDIEKYINYWKDGAISSATYSKIISALMDGHKKK